MVVTTLSVVTRRRVWLNVSATNSFPSEYAIPLGPDDTCWGGGIAPDEMKEIFTGPYNPGTNRMPDPNRAAAPTPSAVPATRAVPAIVLTIPSLDIFRTA